MTKYSFPKNGRQRVVIENVCPNINCGLFPIKRIIGDTIRVRADIFADGHTDLSVNLLFRKKGAEIWQKSSMSPLQNDVWQGEFDVTETGFFEYTIESWVEPFITLQKDIEKKIEANQNIKTDLLIAINWITKIAEGADNQIKHELNQFIALIKNAHDPNQASQILLSPSLTRLVLAHSLKEHSVRYHKIFEVIVEPEIALFSSWYELFPRSTDKAGKSHGTFKDCESIVPLIANMGFNVLYFPPIHPIGKTVRKGRNNSPTAKADDPGSPWSIGSEQGGHISIAPELGSVEDFKHLIQTAHQYNLQIALDIAFQCSHDHPYLTEHPDWFKWRPDGTVQFAENPPKKYEDVVPLDFENEDWKNLWEELRNIIIYWVELGISIFRIDNPHTKPFCFWRWLIYSIKEQYPNVIFLSEAFTRPKVMYELAKVGFSQSYTYFTWRYTKQEFIDYLTELTQTDVKEYFRPNFWPNTPDILPQHLQIGGKPAFIARLILASTLSSNYGLYGPAFELLIREAIPGKEEYLDSEKYEIKHWKSNQNESIQDVLQKINQIRKENPALHITNNLSFFKADNDLILFYGKVSEDQSNIILVAVNLDPFKTQEALIELPLESFGLNEQEPYIIHELLTDEKIIWQGPNQVIKLDPKYLPGKIFCLHKHIKREQDFDYFL